MGGTYLNRKYIHKYTRVVTDRDRLEPKSMIDLVLVKKGEML